MCTFTGTQHGQRPDRVFSNISKYSIIECEDIRHWGIVPRYVLSRRPWWPNLTQCPLNRGKITNTYHAVYTVKLADTVYVLHVFQKKSKNGIATPKKELELIKARLQRAIEYHAGKEEKQG